VLGVASRHVFSRRLTKQSGHGSVNGDVRVRTSSRAWLSLTPEPERELPAALAVLRRAAGGEHGGNGAAASRSASPSGGRSASPSADVAREVERAEALVLRGSEPSYLAWLREAAELAAAGARSPDPEVLQAAGVVRDVVRNQAGLLLGLPGGGRRREAARQALEAVGGTP
jgi:hypothetical protein